MSQLPQFTLQPDFSFTRIGKQILWGVVLICFALASGQANMIGIQEPGSGNYPNSGMVELEAIDFPAPVSNFGWSSNDEASAPRFVAINDAKNLAYVGGGGDDPHLLLFRLSDHTYWKSIALHDGGNNVGRIAHGIFVPDRNELWIIAAPRTGTNAQVLKMTIGSDGTPTLSKTYQLDGMPANHDQTIDGARAPFTLERTVISREVRFRWERHWWRNTWWWFGWYGWNHWGFWWDESGSWYETVDAELWVAVFTLAADNHQFKVEVRALEDVTYQYDETYWYYDWEYEETAYQDLAYEWELLDQSAVVKGYPREIHTVDRNPLRVAVPTDGINGSSNKSQIQGFVMYPSNTSQVDMSYEPLSPVWDRRLDSASTVTGETMILACPNANDTDVVIADIGDWSRNRSFNVSIAGVQVSNTLATFSQTNYPVSESVDGIFYDRSNGWAVFNSSTQQGQLPSSAAFIFQQASTVDNITLHMHYGNGHELKDFELFYTTDANPSMSSTWTAFPTVSFVNAVTNHVINQNHVTVSTSDQPVYELEFTPTNMTAIKLQVNETHAENHNFVLSEFEVAYDTVLNNPGVVAPLNPIVAEIAGMRGHLGFVATNAKRGAHITPVFLLKDDPTEGMILPGLTLSDPTRNIVKADCGNQTGPLYMVTRSRTDTSRPYQLQRVSLTPEHALWSYKINVDSDTFPSRINYFSHSDQGKIRLAIYADNGGRPGTKVWESHEIDNNKSDTWVQTRMTDYAYRHPLYVDSNELKLPAGDYWLAWQTDTPEIAGQDSVGYVPGTPGTGYMKILPYGQFPQTLDLNPPSSRLTDANWALNLTLVDFVAHMGDPIQPPAGADPSRAPVISPTDTAFYHAGEQVCYANYPDLTYLTWYDSAGNPIDETGMVLRVDDEHAVVVYHHIVNRLDMTNAAGTPVVHYNREIVYRAFDGDATNIDQQFPDAWYQQDNKALMFPSSQYVEGDFVLVFQNLIDGVSRVAGVEVVRVLPPDKVESKHGSGLCGHQLLPVEVPPDVVISRAEIVNGDNTSDRYIYLNTRDGIDKYKVYGVKPLSADNRYRARVLFFETRDGVEYPYQITDYKLDWPPPQERIIHIADSPAVDLTANGYFNDHVEWLFVRGDHGFATGNQFEAHGAVLNPEEDQIVRAVLALWHPAPNGDGDAIELIVVDTYNHMDTMVFDPADRHIDWQVGRKIEDTPGFYNCTSGTQCLDCQSGYIYVADTTPENTLYYDTDIYGVSRELHSGPIFPVNEGQLEVWWYHQRKQICWPYRVKSYYSTWDNHVQIASAEASVSANSYPVEASYDGDSTSTGANSGWSSGTVLEASAFWRFREPKQIGSIRLTMNTSNEQLREFELFYTGDLIPKMDGHWEPLTDRLGIRNQSSFASSNNVTISHNKITVSESGQTVYAVQFRPVMATAILVKAIDGFGSSHRFVLTEIAFFQEINLTTQGQYPIILDSHHKSISIYDQPNDTVIGYKPNVEHANVEPAGEQTRVFALRNDIRPPSPPLSSQGYVLVKFLRDGAWGMETYRVIKGDLTYEGVAGDFVAPPYPLNAFGSCRDALIYEPNEAIKSAWVAPDKGVWLARGPSPQLPAEAAVGYASTAVGYYELWKGQCSPWLVPPTSDPIRTNYLARWPEYTQPECAPGTSDCYTTLHVGETVLRPGYSSARILYNDAGIALVDPSKTRSTDLFRLPDGLLPTFPDLRHDVRLRLNYDNSLGELQFDGIMNTQERDMIQAMIPTPPPGTPYSDDQQAFLDAVDDLYMWSNEYRLGSFLYQLPPNVSADLNELGSSLQTYLAYNHAHRRLEWTKPTPLPGDPAVGMTGSQQVSAKQTVQALYTPQPTWTPVPTWTPPANPRATIPPTYTPVPTHTPGYLDWNNAIDDLAELSNNPHTFMESSHIAVSAGSAQVNPGEDLWASVAFTDSNMVEIFRVGCPPGSGKIETLLPDCFFDERVTLHWDGDGGGRLGQLYFHWQVSDVSGSLPAGAYDEAFWIDLTDPDGQVGQNDWVVEGPGLQTVSDYWYRVRYRHPAICNGEWSDWTEAVLKEGWIKRVIRGLNLFDQRIDVNDPLAEIATYSDVIQELGPRFEKMVALNCTPSYVNQLGLIEAYETVLIRAKQYTIDALPPASNLGVNQSLLLMAGKLAGYYKLLGDEAYSDAIDPTIGIAEGIIETNACAMFAFKDQLPNLLQEELALLRGLPKMDMGDITIPRDPDPLVTHLYNKLPWNFTLGDGQTTYVHTYNILDQNSDGFIDAVDALLRFPQAHGDAWGHYMTALKYYYDLLRHPGDEFQWTVMSEATNVNGRPVSVNYQHERSFAQIAAKKAESSQELVNLTYRNYWVDDPLAQWQGYRDVDPEQAWGFSEWSRRAAMGSYFDWAIANAVIPASDTNPAHHGTIEQVDRTSVTDLVPLANTLPAIQAELDQADRGGNPLGLDRNTVAFSLDPAMLDQGVTHFEQIYEKSVQSLQNAQVVFDFANQGTQRLRENQRVVWDFQQNVLAENLSWITRLCKLYGTPYVDDIGLGKTYPEDYAGPDLYHYDYVDVSPLYTETSDPTYVAEFDVVDHAQWMRRFDAVRSSDDGDSWPDDWDDRLDYEFSYEFDELDVEDNVAEKVEFEFSLRGLGLTKPDTWVGRRRAPGDIQIVRSQMLQSYGEMMASQERYEEYLDSFQKAVDSIETHYEYMEMDHEDTVDAHDSIYDNKAAAFAFEVIAKELRLSYEILKDAIKIVKEAAESSKNPMFVTDISGLLNAAASMQFIPIKWGLLIVAEEIETFTPAVELTVMSREHDLEEVLASRHIDLRMKEMLRELFLIANECERRGLELRTSMEKFLEYQSHYFQVLGEGERLLNEYITWRRKVAGIISRQRYDDLGFRVFRNDALERYRQQLDIAARYTYLAARAYDYDTNLLESSPLAGRQYLTDIVRQRHLGYFDHDSGEPQVTGSGLCSLLAQMKENFDTSVKPALGLNNPERAGNQFSLRWELFRIPQSPEYDELWQEALQSFVVEDLRSLVDFQEYCLPNWGSDMVTPQPGIVLRFSTEINAGKNFFGRPLGYGDHSFSVSRFATKVRRLGVWLGDYLPTAEAANLAFTPRVYLAPIGLDVMRIPSIENSRTRYWQVVNQVLPLPYPLQMQALLEDVDWSVWEQNFQGRSYLNRIRHADMAAFPVSVIESGGVWGPLLNDQRDYSTNSQAVGRSVWNTEWILVIPGVSLSNNPIAGLSGLIYGDGSEGSGIQDIFVFFDTYSYAGNEPSKVLSVNPIAGTNQALPEGLETPSMYDKSLADSPNMPPMVLYGGVFSKEDGGRLLDGKVHGIFDLNPNEQSVQVSGPITDITAELNYQLQVNVSENAFGNVDRLVRGERYHAGIHYEDVVDSKSQAELPAAEYGLAYAMPEIAVPGYFSGSPTYTPTQTGTPTETPLPSSTPLPTQTPTASSTFTPLATFTPLPPATPTSTPTPSLTTTFTPTATLWPQYRVHAVLPLTGQYQQYGMAVLRGAQLAVDDINRKGGVSGVPLELLYTNTGSVSTQAISGFQKAIADPATFAVLGAVASVNTLAMAPYAAPNQLPLFTTSTMQGLADYDEYVVKVSPLDHYQIGAMLQKLQQMNVDRVVVLAEDSAYGLGLLQELEHDPNVEVVRSHLFQTGKINVSSALADLAHSPGTTIAGVVAAYAEDANQFLAAAAQDESFSKLQWLLSDAASLDSVIPGMPRSFWPNVFGFRPSTVGFLDAEHSNDFQYQRTYGILPEPQAYYGYDAVLTIAAALQSAEVKSPAGIWQAIDGLSLTGVTGIKHFDREGELIHAIFEGLTISNGSFVTSTHFSVDQPDPDQPNKLEFVSISKESIDEIPTTGFIQSRWGASNWLGYVSGYPVNRSWRLDLPDGTLQEQLFAYNLDLCHEDDFGDEFEFAPNTPYVLNLQLNHLNLLSQPTVGIPIVRLKARAVCEYDSSDGERRFASRDLVDQVLTTSQWSGSGRYQWGVPFRYLSANKTTISDDQIMGNYLKWDLYLCPEVEKADLEEVTLWSPHISRTDLTGNKTTNAEDILAYLRYFQKTIGLNNNFEWLLQMSLEWAPEGEQQ